jgi:serine protease inhibitor
MMKRRTIAGFLITLAAVSLPGVLWPPSAARGSDCAEALNSRRLLIGPVPRLGQAPPMSYSCPGNLLACLNHVHLVNQPRRTADGHPADDGIVTADTKFGFRLFSILTEREPGRNIFISPSSLAMALSMTYNGAAGETKRAMAEALHLRGMDLREVNQANVSLKERLRNPDPDVRLDIANSLWADRQLKLKPDFLKRNSTFYGAEVRGIDFSDPAASDTINGWVREHTGRRIDRIVDEIASDVILYLTNAIYFNGKWTVGFDRRYTRDRDFTLPDGSKIQVPTMMSQSKRYLHLRGDGFQAVGLPYGGGELSMYLFLPDRQSGLAEFYSKMTHGNWTSWMSEFQEEDLLVVLPRFEMEHAVNLNDALTTMGMGAAFDTRADFSQMTSGRAFVSAVVQKTRVEVNEEGTESGSAALVEIKKGPGTWVVFDRPFFCAIVDNPTGLVLFMGAVVDPQ